MSARTLFRRRERHGLHVADPITERIPAVHHDLYDAATRQTLAGLVAQVEAEDAHLRSLRADPLAGGDARWYGWGTTMPDDRAAMPRPYFPGAARRHSPDIAADLAALPAFREAVTRRTRRHAGECLCGSAMGGQGWGERMVRAGMHLTGTGTAA